MRSWTPEETDERTRAQRRAQPTAVVDPRAQALAIQRGAGNQALTRMLARKSWKKVEGGRKVDYADSREEAIEICKVEADQIGIDWEKGIDAAGKETIIRYAMTPVIDGDAAGLPAARDLILAEKREATQKKERADRRAVVDAGDSDYNQLRANIEDNEILAASLDWMKDMYIAGEKSNAKRTLGTKYTRAEVRDAVSDWRGWNDWAEDNLTMFSNLHGYRVGPKAENVGDTLDTRGDQGNILAYVGGTKMNVHINPSD